MYTLVAHAGGVGLVDGGLLLLRATVGLLVIGHAVQKSFGWLGGDGLTATAAIFERVGYAPGRPMVLVASFTEIAGAILLIAGALTPVAGAVILGVMLVACSVHWPFGIWAAQHGFELPMTFAVVAASLALTGPGRWSVDQLLGTDLPSWFVLAALLAALIGAAVLMARRAVVLRGKSAALTDSAT